MEVSVYCAFGGLGFCALASCMMQYMFVIINAVGHVLADQNSSYLSGYLVHVWQIGSSVFEDYCVFIGLSFCALAKYLVRQKVYNHQTVELLLLHGIYYIEVRKDDLSP